MKTRIAAALLLLPAPHVLSGPPGKSPAPAARPGGWRWSAGFMHRSLGDFDWRGNTASGLGLLELGPGENYAGIEVIGSAGAVADRTYTDGFVKVDGGTAENGDTWNWGYQNASQLAGGLLSFHGGDGRRAAFSQADEESSGAFTEGLDGNAPYVELALLSPWREGWSFGWHGAMMYLGTGAEGALSTFSGSRERTDYRITYTDAFDLGGVIAPEAPYVGSLQGPGPLLPNIPATRTPAESIIGGELVTGVNEIATDFDLNLVTFSFGPVLEYSRGPWAAGARAGVTVNFADWDVSTRETLYVSRNGGARVAQNNWEQHGSGLRVLPGVFIQASVSRQISSDWSVELTGRGDWVSSFGMHAGSADGSADVSGWSLGFAVGRRF